MALLHKLAPEESLFESSLQAGWKKSQIILLTRIQLLPTYPLLALA